MTVRTLAYLNGTLLSTGQPAGSITPLRMQDIVDTLNARTGGPLGGGSFVRVTDPEFGADPTGSTDSTTAFQNAMAAGPTFVPALQSNGSIATYLLNNCIVPNGATLIGGSVEPYAGGGIDSQSAARPHIVTAPSAVRIFNVDGKRGIRIEGLVISAAASTTANSCDGISAGCSGMTLRDVLVMYCQYGLGGQVSGSSATYPTASWEANLWGFTCSACTTGVGDLVDSKVFGGNFATCINGMVLGSNSNSSSIIGSRFEWNGRLANGTPAGAGAGLVLGGCDTIQIIGCEFDSNGTTGINITGSYKCNILGCMFRRNGNNVSSGTTLASGSSHVQLSSAYQTTFGNNISHLDSDGAVFAPRAFANFVGNSGANGGLIFIGNDMSGYQGSSAGGTQIGPTNSNTLWFTGTAPTGTGLQALVVKNNLGTGTAAQDVDTR